MCPLVQSQAAVTAHSAREQLLLFALSGPGSIVYTSGFRKMFEQRREMYVATQRQTAVTAHLKSEQLLLFVFVRQTAVTAYSKSRQLLLFAFVRHQ